MAIELRQQLKLSQQLVMTPQLQMAIKLLQLPQLELIDHIRQELEANPALEEFQEQGQEMGVETSPDMPEDTGKITADSPLEEVRIEEKLKDDYTEWEAYFDDYGSSGKTRYEGEEKEAPKFESFIAKKDSLEDHLLWQLLMSSPDEKEEKIGSAIIGNINRDGYLESDIEEIARIAEATAEETESVLKKIQTFDPVGIASRSLAECLLIQLKHLGIEEWLVETIITDHLKNLENRNLKAIAKALKVDVDEVVDAVNLIKTLEPKPGRGFYDEDPIYIVPDIYVYKHEDNFVIMLNDDGMPRLHINSYYKQASSRGGSMNSSAKEYLQEKIRSAAWLIKSIQQRQKTIYSVMESIIGFQREFFEKGVAYLKPMVLRDVALDINMHESTISRVTSNKYAYTPQGIFELKYFFNSSINRVHGEAIASAAVLQKIKQLIESEDPKTPYSDDRIAQLLKTEANVDIARRTVAKYREMMKILPSNKRKQY